MSMHEIESIVEDSVRLILDSKFSKDKKLSIIYNLYDFQIRFDTKYTTFRIYKELRELSYLCSYSEKEMLDAGLINKKEIESLKKDGWCKIKGKEVLYKKEGEEKFFYSEYGDFLWEKSVEGLLKNKNSKVKPDKLGLLELMLVVSELAFDKGDHSLVLDWGSCFISNILFLGIDSKEVASSVESFYLNKEAKKIRAILSKIKSKYKNAKPRSFPWPLKEDFFLDKKNIDLDYIGLFFYNFKKSESKLLEEYKKSLKGANLDSGALGRIPELMQGFNFINSYEEKDSKYWIFEDSDFLKGVKDRNKKFIVIEHNDEFDLLEVHICYQSSWLLKWQNIEGDLKFKNLHFRSKLMHQMPDEELDGRNKNLNYMGGWSFKKKQTFKLLTKRVEDIIRNLQYTKKIDEFYSTPLNQILLNSDLDLISSREVRMKNINKYRFFSNDMDFFYAYACLKWEQDGEAPLKIIEKIEKQIQLVSDRYPLKREWENGLSIIKQEPWFSKTTEFLPYKELDKPAK